MLAGGKILKTVKVEDGACIEDVNIRNAALNFPRQGFLGSQKRSARNGHAQAPDTSSLHRETFDIEDVAWSNGRYSQQIATAAASGKIVLYDLDRPGVEVGRLHEHNRQVHKVDFCPLEGQYLLSASQDGTVRLWDLRTFRHVMKCESKDTFPGRSDGVRHTKWSPTSSASFALGTDNGTVQKWDIRQNRTPALKISAHSRTCNSIDWHPDGRHLLSAGKDQDVKVWDLGGDRKQKPAFQLRAPKPIQNVRWRPPCYVSDGPDQLTKQCTHLATSYKRYPMVHVWDLRRPFVPFRECRHLVNDGTTDMLWHSVHLLWTVGPGGEFCQSDIRYLPITLEQRALSSFSSSEDGELMFFSQPRATRRPSSAPKNNPEQASNEHVRQPSKSPNSWGSKVVKGDDSLDENFLSTSYPRRGHARSESFKSTKSVGSTPPSYEDFARPVTDLDQTMRRAQVAPPDQNANWGHVSFIALNPIFTVIARKMKTIRASDSITLPQLLEALETILTSQIRRVSRTGDFRTAQDLALSKKLIEEDLRDLEHKYGVKFKEALHVQKHLLQSERDHGLVTGEESPLESVNEGAVHAGSLVPGLRARIMSEPPSDAATPLVKPQSDCEDFKPQLGTPPLDLNFGSLDPSPEQSRPTMSHQETSQTTESSETLRSESSIPQATDSGPNLMDSPEREARRQRLRDYRQLSQAPLSFENTHPASQSRNIPPRPHRHNSSESFQMFSTSSDSQKLLSAHGSFASGIVQNRGRSRSSSLDTRLSEPSATMRPDLISQSFTSSVIESSPEYTRSALSSFNSNSENTRGTEQSKSVSETEHPGRNQAGDRSPIADVNKDQSTQNISRLDASEHDLEENYHQLEKSQSTIMEEPLALTRSSVPLGTTSDGQGTMSLVISEAMQSLNDLLSYHATNGEAQIASNLFTTISPLLSYISNVTISKNGPFARGETHTDGYRLSTDSTVATTSYNEALQTVLSLTPMAAQTVLDSCHRPLEAVANLSPTFIEAILSTYHEQLLSLKLHSEAALIRRLSFPAFPAVYEQGQLEVDAELCCVECGDAVSLLSNGIQCDSCNTQQPECPICWQTTTPFSLTEPLQPKSRNKNKFPRRDVPVSPTQGVVDVAVARDPSTTSLFPNYQDRGNMAYGQTTSTKIHTSCPLCAHTLHAACSITWFSDPENEGICPVDSCLCPCAPGSYRAELDAREQSATQRQAAMSRVRRGGSLGTVEEVVRRDDWDVGESKAVRRVVGALRDSDAAAMSEGEGHSPQRARAVKFERRRSESVEGRARYNSDQNRRQSEDGGGPAITGNLGWGRKGALSMGLGGGWSGS